MRYIVEIKPDPYNLLIKYCIYSCVGYLHRCLDKSGVVYATKSINRLQITTAPPRRAVPLLLARCSLPPRPPRDNLPIVNFVFKQPLLHLPQSSSDPLANSLTPIFSWQLLVDPWWCWDVLV